MKTTITRDTLDGADWILVDCVAAENRLDNDRIILLELIARKHGLRVSKSQPSSQFRHGEFEDSLTVHIENPTRQFEKEFLLWTLGAGRF